MSRSVWERLIFLSSSGNARGCHEVPRWGTGACALLPYIFLQNLPAFLRELVPIPVLWLLETGQCSMWNMSVADFGESLHESVQMLVRGVPTPADSERPV